MENEKYARALNFNLDKEQFLILDAFYLSLKQVVHMSGAYFECESYIIKNYCDKYELDFCDVLRICKRLVNAKNKDK